MTCNTKTLEISRYVVSIPVEQLRLGKEMLVCAQRGGLAELTPWQTSSVDDEGTTAPKEYQVNNEKMECQRKRQAKTIQQYSTKFIL